LRIRDDGEGIPADILEHGRPGHYGLAGIREQARQAGAKLTIDSRAGAGTEIECKLAGSIAYCNSRRRSRFQFFGKRVD
jgi:signal transduction histidine kinase